MTDPNTPAAPQPPVDPAAAVPPAYQPPVAPPAYAPPAAPAYNEASGYNAASAYAGQPAAAVPGKTLGIVALIVTFFSSVIGLILGYVAASQSKKAGVPNTPAKVAIILGWIFTVIGTLVIIGVIVTAVVAVNSVQEACNQLGTGVWQLDNGATITCD
ncbi:DUF4190 domain-containing protein [Microbacterium sp.]|uniref:DUF4190 domain-containing protein n=1 Tax=Microbacterium sp. TaxID=51671 RepID=UPI0039E2E86A